MIFCQDLFSNGTIESFNHTVGPRPAPGIDLGVFELNCAVLDLMLAADFIKGMDLVCSFVFGQSLVGKLKPIVS
ncbi:hypothetical protein M1M94_01720 [Thermodesulfovibrionales bacterium]|nr:hypothetical protein [Thermodesulfovibrionales bacterium]